MSEPFQPQRREAPRRTQADRRRLADRRQRRRRMTTRTVPSERRRLEDRRHASRRSGRTRRSGQDRRAGARGTAPAATPKLGEQDRIRARLLADEFVTTGGTPEQRVARIVRTAWPRHPLPVRAGIAEAVLPILRALAEGGTVDDPLRDACEAAAARWLVRVRR